jgi:predicted DCC family thiol-disulfide oxidoreductase YuxK
MSTNTEINTSKTGFIHTLDRAWFQADPRALGLFRIAFGLLCMHDVLRRMPWITTFYSNSGTLSNHYGLYAPIFRPNVSLLSGFSSPAEVTCFFVFTLVCLFMFTIGYRTRLFHLLSWLCVLSIHSRNTMLANGGDVVMNIWWLWTLWLPLGVRFSIDSLRQSLASNVDDTPTALRHATEGQTNPIRSLAVLMVLWQLSLIYFFNSVPHKTGVTWQEGTAIGYALEQDRVITPLALWAKDVLPLWSTQALSWGTLVIEGLAPLLLLTPWFRSVARRVFLVCMVGLHLGIWLLMDVGLFSFCMMVSFFIILTPREIALLKHWLTKLAGKPVRASYDAECPFSFQMARFIARLDRLRRIEWYPRSATPMGAVGDETGEFDSPSEHGLIVVERGGVTLTGYRGTLRILTALPLGRPFAWVGMLPVLSHVLRFFGRWAGTHRQELGAWFGCSLTPGEGNRLKPAFVQRTSAQTWRRRFWMAGSTGLLLFFFSAMTSQMLVENRFISKTIGVRVTQPEVLRKTVSITRTFQGWSMFAPDVPTRDGWLVIDAELPDGTHVDPQTGREPEFIAADARKMRWDQFWGSYSMRIASGRFSGYRSELVSWLTNQKIKRLKLPAGQRIRSLKVWWIGDVSPNPKVGGNPVIDEKRLIATWPKAQRRKTSVGK